MLHTLNETTLNDNGGRRSGIDRRQFLYSTYIPERRLNEDRRKISDRRTQNRVFEGTDRRRGGAFPRRS